MRACISGYGPAVGGACDAPGGYGGCEAAVAVVGGNDGLLNGEAPFREKGC